MEQRGKHSEEYNEKNRVAHLGQIPWHKGKVNVYSEEVLKKMSKRMKGHILWNKDRTNVYSEETLRRISNSRKGKGKRFGTDNPNWKGGIAPENHKIRNSIEIEN